MKITREEIQDKLLDWQKGHVSTKQIYDWANEVCANDDNEFADQAGDESISSEVLFLLEVLDMNLSTVEDVPLYLKLLTASKGSFDMDMKEFNQKFKARDLDRRKKLLRSDPIYSKFIE